MDASRSRSSPVNYANASGQRVEGIIPGGVNVLIARAACHNCNVYDALWRLRGCQVMPNAGRIHADA
jgi:hypothetical protein